MTRIVSCLGFLAITSCSGCFSSTRAKTSPAGPSVPILRFVDVQENAGIRFTHSDGGCGRHFFVEQVGSGCAFVDVDNDGLLDVYAVSGSPLPGYTKTDKPRAELWRNLGKGAFEQITDHAGVGLKRFATGVSAADYDNDGDLDLFVTCYGRNALYCNRGNGTFEDVARAAGVAGDGKINVSSAFLDYDNDGFADLYVCRYVDWELKSDRWCGTHDVKKTYCGPEVYPSRTDRLYRNRGDGSFEDVTERSGIKHAQSKSLGVVPTDLNNDGWMDLYVANDLEANLLFMNTGKGTFVERGVQFGVAYGPDGGAEAGMGVAAGDFDNDRQMDLFVTNYSFEMYALYRNAGKDLFTYESLKTGIGPATLVPLGFGTRFADLDNDGWRDIAAANGHVLDDCHESHQALEYAQTMQMFLNEGGKRYREVSSIAGPAFQQKFVGRGLASGDYDNDGRIDFLVNNVNGPLRLIRNESSVAGQWVGLRLKGKRANRSALGARVSLRSATGWQTQEVTSGSSYLSQSDLRLHFGLDHADSAVNVEVRWPGPGKKPGTVESWKDLMPGKYHEIVEGESQGGQL